ncbi:RagB/SusD family nutrient uptake outer membrane protein [uncultured Bacteroides sp.]|uniref:RagB/SusD family nutrient uptake outer membrane protein n=1 Tax=uncultured Bacteroides sp. TaxID=162156 RepID=UPI002627A136|nr:RagB/SusD family nutrient uptake outer membrane protein [uncultured Bacteroides sp.]
MKKINKLAKGCMVLVSAAMLASCTDSFLEQDPLSFYNPGNTYTTESGLRSAMAMCDLGLKEMLMDGNSNLLPIASVYFMSDIGLYAKTDATNRQDDFANKLTPTSGMKGGGDENAMSRFWDRGWVSIKFANTVLSYVDQVESLDEKTRNEYKGRAYFHRAYGYYHQALLFGDIPLVTKIIEVPKQNYKSTSKEAIFQMLVHDLEFAVKNVPAQKDMPYMGTVNQEACMQLLIKCYLVIGEYKKAEEMATDLINNHGLALMEQSFGTFVPSGSPETWNVERNVIWDLHRGDNVTAAANKETIMPILNFDSQSFIGYPLMRAMCVHWSNGDIIDPHKLGSPTYNWARNNGSYSKELDWLRVLGRGIGCFRTSHHYNKTIWNYDGEEDTQDLRHNRNVGNWVEMTDIKYNRPNSDFYGKNMQLYATEDYITEKDTVLAGTLLCKDTIRSWYPIPLYKVYIVDESASENMGANQFNGATKGTKCSNGNLYLFRLAETYLLRAEAKFYQGNTSGAAEDVNAVRRRANAKKMFTTVTIGDIVDERARELYLEEWRQPELTRISWCLARSGKPDEWGDTYDLATWDKQTGTDLNGGSYWYKRCTRYSLYNRGPIFSKVMLNYQVAKHNMFWPVPNSAITANIGAQLRQNYGYDGYDDTVPMFTNWEEAVADEETTK